MANKIKLKRGLAADVDSLTLDSGELAIVLDSNKLKFGDANGLVKDIEAVSADSAKRTTGTLTVRQNGNALGSFNGSSNQILDISTESSLATFEIREDGNLYAIGNDINDLNAYSINENGDLILTLNGAEKNLGHVVGDGGSAVIPDLEDYATKEYVDTNYVTQVHADANYVTTDYMTTNYMKKTTIENDYATKTYVNNALSNLSFVTLTKAEYNALTTKNANTLYIIKES